MSLGVKRAVVLLQLEDGRIVQRPMTAVETDIVAAMLCEQGTGNLKTVPAHGIKFARGGDIQPDDKVYPV